MMDTGSTSGSTGKKKEVKEESKHFWFVAAPNSAHGGARNGLANMQAKAGPSCTTVATFSLPALRIGTLDSLLTLSEDIAKRDTFMEATTRKIARQLFDLYSEGESASDDTVGHDKILMVNGVTLEKFLSDFEWDEAKYKLSSPLKDVVEAISLTMSKIDEDMKSKATAYQGTIHTIAAEKRKATGNLMVRELSDVVKPESIIDSEYLTTLLVVVPKSAAKDWLASYEELTENVVPRSSDLLFSDNEFHLYNVILFKNKVDEFKTQARLKRWTVRDAKIDPKAAAAGQEDLKKQESKKRKQRNNLIRWCRLNFGEAFTAWTHLKAIRVFIEAILRFGVPPDFTAFLLEPSKSGHTKLRKTLDTMYAGLDTGYLKDMDDDAMNAFVGPDKFYAYVWTKMQISTGIQ